MPPPSWRQCHDENVYPELHVLNTAQTPSWVSLQLGHHPYLIKRPLNWGGVHLSLRRFCSHSCSLSMSLLWIFNLMQRQESIINTAEDLSSQQRTITQTAGPQRQQWSWKIQNQPRGVVPTVSLLTCCRQSSFTSLSCLICKMGLIKASFS